jgi:hypothetical protein
VNKSVEEASMRALLRSILAVLTLGMISLGCNKPNAGEEADVSACNVILRVPGMT